MIDPVNDPIFGENSDTRRLLERANETTIGSLASAWSRLNYSPSTPAYNQRVDDPAATDIGPRPEPTSFLDTLNAAWHLNNLTGALSYRISDALARNVKGYGQDPALVTSADPKWNIQSFAKENYSQFTDAAKAAYQRGEFDTVLSPTEFYTRYAQVEQDAQYHRDLANARGPGGFIANVAGSIADPVGLVVGLGVGKVAAGAYQIARATEGAALASDLANLGAQQTVKAGLFSRVGTSVAQGVPIAVTTETGLQALDKKRTLEEGVSNVATGIVMDSFLSAGLAALGKAPLFSQKGLGVVPDAALTDELRKQVQAAVEAKVAPPEVVQAAQEIAAGAQSAGPSQPVQGYSDYLFRFPGVNPARSKAILDVLDKYGQNGIAPLRPTSSLEQTTSGPLAMLYNYFVVPRGPSIGLSQGRTGGTQPFEMISELVRGNGNRMQETAAKAFKEFVVEQGAGLQERAILNTPDALWVGAKGQALLSKQDAFFNLAGKVYVLAHGTDEAIAKGLPLESIAEAGLKNFQETAPAELAKYLGQLGEADTAKVSKSLQKLYSDTLPTMNQLWIDGALRAGQQNARPVSLALLGDLQARLPEGFGSEDGNFTLSDFTRLWDTIRDGAAAPNQAAADRIASTLEYFQKYSNGIDNVDVQRLVPTHETLGRLKNAYYTQYGGYVPAPFAAKAATLTAENGATLVDFNYLKLLSQTTEGKHLWEGARQLRDLITDASVWDQRLKEYVQDQTKDLQFEDAPYGLPNVAKGGTTDRFNLLAGTNLQTWKVNNDIPPFPLSGYRQELENWTNEALATVRQNIINQIPETPEALRPPGSDTSTEWIGVEKNRVNDLVRQLKDRLNIQYASKAQWENTLSRNVGAFTRGLYLPLAFKNLLPEAFNTIFGTATSAFKGDMLAVVQGALSQLRRDAIKTEDLPFIYNHIEYMNDTLLSTMYKNTTYLRRVEDLNRAVKGFTPGDRTAAWFEGIAQPAIATASGATAVNDFVRSAAFHSTNAQLSLKGGLITRMAKVVDDLDAGVSFQEALTKHNVPLFYGSTMLRDFRPDEIRALNKLVENDTTAGLVTPRRFGLSSLVGDAEVRVLDLPENATIQDKAVLQKLGTYMSYLITKDKQSLPGWTDDLIGGTNNVWKYIGTFWTKPTIAQFNHMFYQAQYKGDVALASGVAGGLLGALTARMLGVYLNGNIQSELDNARKNWTNYVTQTLVDRAAWAGLLGVGGEKVAAATISGLLPNPSGRAGRNALIPAPLEAIWEATQGAFAVPRLGLSAAFGDGTVPKSNADSLWRLLSAIGFSNDTTAFRLMGQAGRITGVYGEENNATDIKNAYYKLFGVEDKKR